MGFKDGTVLVRTNNPDKINNPEAPTYNYRIVYSPGQRYVGYMSDRKRGFEIIMEVLRGEPVAHDYDTAKTLAKQRDNKRTYYGVCELEFDEYY